MQLLAQVAADYQLEVRLVNYSNPSHVRSDGSLCDHGADTPCDNIFMFEVDIGRGLEQLKQTEIYIDRDEIVFSDSLLDAAQKNPLIFQIGGLWQSNVSQTFSLAHHTGTYFWVTPQICNKSILVSPRTKS